MRIAAVIFVAAHGIGHIIWFMSTWARWSLGGPGRAELAKHEGNFLVEPSSPAGRAVGILALLVVIGFLAAAWGIWREAAWWPPLLIAAAVASLPVLLSMWNPIGIVSFNAFVANLGLGAATLMPWGERFLGAH